MDLGIATLASKNLLNFSLAFSRHISAHHLNIRPLAFASRRTFFFEARAFVHPKVVIRLEICAEKCAIRATTSVNWKNVKRFPRQEKITKHQPFAEWFCVFVSCATSRCHSPLFWHRVALCYVYNSISLIVNARINWYIHIINLLLFTVVLVTGCRNEWCSYLISLISRWLGDNDANVIVKLCRDVCAQQMGRILFTADLEWQQKKLPKKKEECIV